MTSLDSSEGVGSWTVVSVAQLMDHLLARFEPRAAQQEITLTLASSPRRGLAVKGDTGRLIQALAEVVRNALAFTPAGGSVEISANEQDGSGRPGVTIKVQDTGPGIPDDEMPRVLERFFRGRITESGQYPGAGLGLNIAQSIVVTHNGRLSWTAARVAPPSASGCRRSQPGRTAPPPPNRSRTVCSHPSSP